MRPVPGMRRLLAAIILPVGALAAAGALVGSRYTVSIPLTDNGSANTASPGYMIRTGVIGEGMYGSAKSADYHNSGGFTSQVTPMATPPAADLNDAYVYPNPFKPNSPGGFQAAKLTFKHLPAEAKIRIFEITGRLVAELHKTDSAVDYYEWNVTNSDGRKLASGVYLYFITASNGGRAKGKFAVIR